MTQTEANRWAQELAQGVRAVVEKYPQADPENVRHTLILLQMSPEERLARSLLRGGVNPQNSMEH